MFFGECENERQRERERECVCVSVTHSMSPIDHIYVIGANTCSRCSGRGHHGKAAGPTPYTPYRHNRLRAHDGLQRVSLFILFIMISISYPSYAYTCGVVWCGCVEQSKRVLLERHLINSRPNPLVLTCCLLRGYGQVTE